VWDRLKLEYLSDSGTGGLAPVRIHDDYSIFIWSSRITSSSSPRNMKTWLSSLESGSCFVILILICDVSFFSLTYFSSLESSDLRLRIIRFLTFVFTVSFIMSVTLWWESYWIRCVFDIFLNELTYQWCMIRSITCNTNNFLVLEAFFGMNGLKFDWSQSRSYQVEYDEGCLFTDMRNHKGPQRFVISRWASES